MVWGLFSLAVAAALIALHDKGDWIGAFLIVGNIAVGIYHIQKALS